MQNKIESSILRASAFAEPVVRAAQANVAIQECLNAQVSIGRRLRKLDVPVPHQRVTHTRESMSDQNASRHAARIPRNRDDDYTHEAAATRRAFLKEQTGATLEHVGSYSFDPGMLPGNVENFTGVAQVPLGVVGPIRVKGEHARGDFYVPMATCEGTLLASLNRGMRILSECDGVRTTVAHEAMQRAPVFLFDSAAEARSFSHWLDESFVQIKAAAEATTSVGKLTDIAKYPAARHLYTRFNFVTGDAAGQNLSSKATLAACEWIIEHYPKKINYMLSGAMNTDKKHSLLNVLQTRGRRVVAEAVLKNEVLQSLARVTTEQLYRDRQIQDVGAFMAGSAFNGFHAANALTALFIACGQDAADVSESHTGITYLEMLEGGDLYYSVTLPALIVGTHGGGTGLATQRECLQLLGCTGEGSANKFAEICAATVLAGEVSLAAAILANEWVSSHDRFGRNS